MQSISKRRSNAQRTAETRAALIAAARAIFIEKGFAETATPDIVEAAGVTRGALYHHFADKTALFRAVVETEATAVADEIRAKTPADLAPLDGLLEGAAAYFDSMAVPGRAQLMLIDGPAVLGHPAMREISQQTDGETLLEGLQLLAGRRKDDVPSAATVATAELLSAMFDRAALAIATGEDLEPYQAAFVRLLRGLLP